MKVSIHLNGRLEFKLYDPANAVEVAALKAMQAAVEKGTAVSVESVAADPKDAIVISVEV